MSDDQRDLIVRDPNICHGQATVRGTRIMVSVVLDALADGMTEEEIIAEYPTLTVEGIRAAAAYGAELARDEYPAVAARPYDRLVAKAVIEPVTAPNRTRPKRTPAEGSVSELVAEQRR
ncbi:MAG: DUF433 domain-containing protein [Actinobacteria bacterium]|nr:DUF433 domain-containing protein [Actinomycetota bacterium]